jgi:hypothetical protein
MSPNWWKRAKDAPTAGALDSPAIRSEIAAGVHIMSSAAEELDAEQAEYRRAVSAYSEVLDQAAAEYGELLESQDVSPDEAFSLVHAETGDKTLAARVRSDLWIRQLRELDNDAILALSVEVEKGPPQMTESLALDAERARRGLPSASPLEVPSYESDPSWTPEQTRHMAASARYWELNERVAAGGASPTEIEEWQRVSIELKRAATAMNADTEG